MYKPNQVLKTCVRPQHCTEKNRKIYYKHIFKYVSKRAEIYRNALSVAANKKLF